MADFTFPAWGWDVLRRLAPVVLTDDVERLGLVDGVIREMERLLTAAPGPAGVALIAGLGTFNVGARGFARMGPAEAEAYFETWWHSPIPLLNQFAKGVKALLCFGYYELPGVQAAIGYTPTEWIDKVKIERLERFGKEIAAFEAELLTRDPLPRTGPRPR
jgi:hypothetical protein